MRKTLTLVQVKDVVETDTCFEAGDGFLVNRFGKYAPNMTFVVGREFELDSESRPVNPLEMTSDREVTESFNLDLDGKADFLFGDFWRSKKGGACFRPKDPSRAKHLLVRVDWGGAFDRSRGYCGNAVKECDAIYFRVASSNGGGTGYDYWVLPVGYVAIHDAAESEPKFRIDRGLAKAYCAKHSELIAGRRAEADRFYKEKVAAEAASLAAKSELLPRLRELQVGFEELDQSSCQRIGGLEEDKSYFLFANSQRLYTAENVAELEKILAERQAEAKKAAAERAEAEQRRERFLPSFEALQGRAQAVGLEIVTDDLRSVVLKKLGHFGGASELVVGDYVMGTYDQIDARIREGERELEAQRQAERKLQAEAEAKAAGLPSDIRIWKRTGSRTGCSKAWVISVDGVERERDELYNKDSRYAQRYDEGYEIWHQILPGELVVKWAKACTADEHELEVVYRPEAVTEAQLERLAEILTEINEDWKDCVGLASKKPSPLIDIEAFLAEVSA